MRICDSSIFPLKLEIQHLQGGPEDCKFTICDSDCVEISAEYAHSQYTTQVQIAIRLPVKLMIEIRSNDPLSQLELVSFNLAGISVQKDKLLRCLEYRDNSAQLDHQRGKTLIWMPPCHVCLDLFDANPFAWHLYIGNKIQFR